MFGTIFTSSVTSVGSSLKNEAEVAVVVIHMSVLEAVKFQKRRAEGKLCKIMLYVFALGIDWQIEYLKGHYTLRVRYKVWSNVRRNLQLLKIMYHQSKSDRNIKVSVRPTGAAEKIVFNVPSKCTSNYLSSSYYLGTLLWNSLPENTQRMVNMKDFEKGIAPQYNVYQAPRV